MAYKTFQVTFSEDLAQRLWLNCSEEASNGVRYIMFGGNPQDVVREALYFYEAIPKQQPKGSGDRSQWRPGQPVKVSLWEENANALTEAAKAVELTKQELTHVAVSAYLNQIDKTLK